MSRLTWDGTAKSVSLDQIIRRKHRQEIFVFPVQLTPSRIGNLIRLIHTLSICNSKFARLGTDYEIMNQWFFAILVCGHTYVHT